MFKRLLLLPLVALSACEVPEYQVCLNNSPDVQAYRPAASKVSTSEIILERGFAYGLEIDERQAARISRTDPDSIRRKCARTTASGRTVEYDCLYTISVSGNVRVAPISLAEERRILARNQAELDRLTPKYNAAWDRCLAEHPAGFLG